MSSKSIKHNINTAHQDSLLIAPSNLFYTPESMEELTDRIESYTGSEKMVAWSAAMMAWNLACKIVNEQTAVKPILWSGFTSVYLTLHQSIKKGVTP